jgi:hypothetical protein
VVTPPRPGGTPATRTPGFEDGENLDEVTVAADARKLLSNLDAPSSSRSLRPYAEDAKSGDIATVAQGSKGGKAARKGETPSQPSASSQPISYDEPTVLRAPDATLPDFGDSEPPKPVIPQTLPSEDLTERHPPDEMAEYARNLVDQRERDAQAGSAKAAALGSEEAPQRLLGPSQESPARGGGIGPWLWGALLVVIGALAGIYFFQPELISRWVPLLSPTPPDTLPEVPVPQTSSPVPSASPASSASAPSASASEMDAAPPEAEATAAGPFNKKAAWGALGVVANGLSRCAAPEAESVTGDVLVTFVPSGRVSFVEVKGDLKGSPMEGCVAQAFRRVTVPPFSGDPVHLARSVSVP